jgi:hypothetical protein
MEANFKLREQRKRISAKPLMRGAWDKLKRKKKKSPA